MGNEEKTPKQRADDQKAAFIIGIILGLIAAFMVAKAMFWRC